MSIVFYTYQYRGGPGIPPPPSMNFPPEFRGGKVIISLREEKMAVVLHTSDGNLGAVS